MGQRAEPHPYNLQARFGVYRINRVRSARLRRALAPKLPNLKAEGGFNAKSKSLVVGWLVVDG